MASFHHPCFLPLRLVTTVQWTFLQQSLNKKTNNNNNISFYLIIWLHWVNWKIHSNNTIVCLPSPMYIIKGKTLLQWVYQKNHNLKRIGMLILAILDIEVFLRIRVLSTKDRWWFMNRFHWEVLKKKVILRKSSRLNLWANFLLGDHYRLWISEMLLNKSISKLETTHLSTFRFQVAVSRVISTID